MSFEVEIKFRASGAHADLARQLAALGAEPAAACEQEDIYLSHPARDFGVTGEAFRLRREGNANRVTYKGPRQAGPTKTRREIEVEFAAGADAQQQMFQIFELLGFQPVATVRKRRQPYHLVRAGRAIEVVLDVAEGLGAFAEVETIAADSADLPAAQAAVLDLARALGLDAVEPRSYLRMALEKRNSAARAGGPETDAIDPRNMAGHT